jgi:hypothetical protein
MEIGHHRVDHHLITIGIITTMIMIDVMIVGLNDHRHGHDHHEEDHHNTAQVGILITMMNDAHEHMHPKITDKRIPVIIAVRKGMIHRF